MKTISKGKLKPKMLEVFREIERSGEELIVTDNKKPVLRIQPIRQKLTVKELFGNIQGQVIYHEDLDQPTVDEWPSK
ncbi:MAG: prevent-host-death protein [Acidobacteria bacterium]|nr:MAG: prevent-host-death protein [Acidobacteriota bacterium]